MNINLKLKTTVTKEVTVWPKEYDERVKSLPFSMSRKIESYYDYTYNFRFVWYLNSAVKGLVESVDVYVNNKKVKANIMSTNEYFIVVGIELEGTTIKAEALYYPDDEWCKLDNLNSIYINDIYEDSFKEMVYRNNCKPLVDEAINEYIAQEKARKEKELADKQAFIEYAHSQNVRYWAEQDYFGGFISNQRSYVFSATEEWIEEKKKGEYLWDDGWYQISHARPIEEFPYWKKAFEEKDNQEMLERLGLGSSLTWFKDKGSILTKSI